MNIGLLKQEYKKLLKEYEQLQTRLGQLNTLLPLALDQSLVRYAAEQSRISNRLIDIDSKIIDIEEYLDLLSRG